MTKYTRNIQGQAVELELVEVDPQTVSLDASNPRVSYSMRQLPPEERNEAACLLLLTSQEETETLKRSIVASGGVQEPIYVRASGVVAEGNRRVVALRAAAEEYPADARFRSMPAWRIAVGTPETAVQNLLNEIHIGSVRGWAPYEKALQLRSLYAQGLTEEEIAERYRISSREVRQQLDAVAVMERDFFPVTANPADPDHRAKFSYFLEFEKNGRLQELAGDVPDLRARFACWVRDGRIETGATVRRLPKILSSKDAIALLDVAGAKAANEFLAKTNPEEQELYAVLEKARVRLSVMTVTELRELKSSPPRQAILRELHGEVSRWLAEVGGG